MSFQRGALRKVHLKAGDRWMLRYRMTRADGKRLECREFVGLVRDFPTEKAARREIERSGLLARINAREADIRIRFHALALHSGPHKVSQITSPRFSRPWSRVSRMRCSAAEV
jgi:hypothetical protein